jgi:hypothetical protein
LTRKKDKVENEKEVGDQDGFYLADRKSEYPSFFLRLRPVIKPCPEKDCQKYPPPFGEVPLNQS